ncbi:MAG: copper chaperone PCu(A)C [Sphingomonas sp.]|nr:copper chaperone PCu(A)C [Sphingomonas sp.]RZV53213.1 MAG: copper chaperone PCu(A)C [Sphingomonadaceae bacterium]
MRKLVLFAAFGLAACGGSEPDARVAIGDGWARATIDGQPMGAAYLTITNTGGVPVTLTGASSPVAAGVGLHGTNYDDGIARMRPITQIVLEPGERHEFAPGSDHLMLEGLSAPLKSGRTFPVTLDFETIPDQTVEIAVIDAGSR